MVFRKPGKHGLEHEIRATGDGYSLIESCSPVLLTWMFVAVMNILPGIVEASLGCSVFSCSSTQGRLCDSTDGWLDLFFSSSSVIPLYFLMKFITCVIEVLLGFMICSWCTMEINQPPENHFEV